MTLEELQNLEKERNKHGLVVSDKELYDYLGIAPFSLSGEELRSERRGLGLNYYPDFYNKKEKELKNV